MKKPLQPHLLKRVPPACKGERTMRWRGGPPIGGQDSDGVSNRRSALYTLCLFEAFPSRGNEKYGEEKQRVIYFTYHFGVFPLWWLAPPPCPVGSMSLDSRVAGLPYESSSFATPAVRWGGKRKAP